MFFSGLDLNCDRDICDPAMWLASVATIIVLLPLNAALPQGLWAESEFALLLPRMALAVFIMALACEYLDSSLGMGYGTTLTPILLLAGFAPLDIVPAILLSEALTGAAAGARRQPILLLRENLK